MAGRDATGCQVPSGRLVDGRVFEEAHWEDASRTAWYVNVAWDRVVRLEDRLPIEELLAALPGHNWNATYSSGQELDAATADQLESAWALHTLVPDEVSWTTPVGEALTRRALASEDLASVGATVVCGRRVAYRDTQYDLRPSCLSGRVPRFRPA